VDGEFQRIGESQLLSVVLESVLVVLVVASALYNTMKLLMSTDDHSDLFSVIVFRDFCNRFGSLAH
jgi:hypothetical protein